MFSWGLLVIPVSKPYRTLLQKSYMFRVEFVIILFVVDFPEFLPPQTIITGLSKNGPNQVIVILYYRIPSVKYLYFVWALTKYWHLILWFTLLSISWTVMKVHRRFHLISSPLTETSKHQAMWVRIPTEGNNRWSWQGLNAVQRTPHKQSGKISHMH